MDLAEIRKKARAEKTGENAAGNAQTGLRSAREASTIQGTPDEKAQIPGADVSPPEPSAPQKHRRDPLEELFSEREDLHLATEETYYQGLIKGDEQNNEVRREWLTFTLGDEEYALDIEGIAEIIKPLGITEIPRAPEYILGIISLRGVVIPVFDLRKRLRLGAVEDKPSSRIIVCQEGDLVAGMLVESITQVFRISERNIEPPPNMLPDLDDDLVEGVGRHQGRLLILLNLAKILNTENALQ